MVKPCIIEPEAQDDLDSACVWYEGQRVGLSLRFLDGVGETLVDVSSRPASFPLRHGNCRRALVKNYPYLTLFVERPADVLVVGVFHTARKPSTIDRRAASF